MILLVETWIDKKELKREKRITNGLQLEDAVCEQEE